MATVHKTREFDKDPDELWALIGDFHGIHKWISGVEPSESLDDGKGRKLAMGGASIIERLLEEHERSYTYSMDDDSPMPFVNYRSTLSVKDAANGKSVVDWRGEFDPAPGTPEETAVQIVTMVYDGGLDGLAKTLGS